MNQCICECDCHYEHIPEYGKTRRCGEVTSNDNGKCDDCNRNNCTPSDFPKPDETSHLTT